MLCKQKKLVAETQNDSAAFSDLAEKIGLQRSVQLLSDLAERKRDEWERISDAFGDVVNALDIDNM